MTVDVLGEEIVSIALQSQSRDVCTTVAWYIAKDILNHSNHLRIKLGHIAIYDVSMSLTSLPS